jgi:hypothetical protein
LLTTPHTFQAFGWAPADGIAPFATREDLRDAVPSKRSLRAQYRVAVDAARAAMAGETMAATVANAAN